MLHMESPHHGIYVPLSQVMTDSESEEEIHNSSKHRQQQLLKKQQHQLQKQNRRLGNRNPPTTLALNQQPQQQRRQQRLQQQREHKIQIACNTAIANGHHQPSSYTTNMQKTFRSVMMSTDIGLNGEGGAHCDPGSNFSSFNSDYDERNHIDADNVAILGNGDSKELTNEPMTTARRCCFVASILLCIFAVVGLVWLVPCGDGSACPAPGDRVKTHNWLNNYTKLELKGGVNIVNGLRSWENNLIFLYRGDAFFPEFRVNNAKRNGIISLIGSSGAVAWYVEMMDEPVAIDCTLLDVDHNNRPDCLVIDEYGELGAINPISGQWHWHFKERSAYKVDAFDFPVILPDLDGDGVLEILVVTSAALEQRVNGYMRKGEIRHGGGQRAEERNFLRILSGRSGKPIGEGFKVHDCEDLRKLQLDVGAQMVTYNCLRNHTELHRSKTLSELFALITNKSIVGTKLVPASEISQHRHYGQRKDIDAQRNIYSLSGRELVVENRGKCPEDCNVTLILSENRNGQTNIIRNFTSTNMYGMVPAQWHFKNTKTKMSGFVMKFWKWNNVRNDKINTTASPDPRFSEDAYQQKSYNVKKPKGSTMKENVNRSNKPNMAQVIENNSKTSNNRRKRQINEETPNNREFDAFEHLIEQRHTYTLNPTNEPGFRVTRSVSNATNNKQKPGENHLFDKYKMQMITETVILILFIGADTRIENTSQSNIVQFCRDDHSEMVCQPDLNNQENSMLIADLDQDGSQELVSYMSTFVQASDAPQDWKLVTYVRLLRLQSELPAFYDTDKRN